MGNYYLPGREACVHSEDCVVRVCVVGCCV